MKLLIRIAAALGAAYLAARLAGYGVTIGTFTPNREDLELWQRFGEPRSLIVVGTCIVPEDIPAEVASGAFYSLIVIGSIIASSEVLTALDNRLKVVGAAVPRGQKA